MKPVAIEDPVLEDLGPAMLALNDMQRRFVVGVIQAGGKMPASKIAAAAGYSNKGDAAKVRAHGLVRNQKVLAALKEEADRRFDWTGLRSIFQLESLVEHKDPKIRLKAIDSVLDRRGYARQTNQQVSMQIEQIDTRSTAQIMAEINRLLGQKTQLPVLETTFEDVTDDKED